MDHAEYASHDAVGLAALVRGGRVSPTELLDAAVARMEEVDGAVNAVNQRHVERGYQALAAGLPDGVFRGVPFLLKDQFQQWAGTVTTAGSRLFVSPATSDSTLVTRYLAAGLVLFGKTNSPELAVMPTTEPLLFGPTRNPYDLARSAGGSSGGAAAAVAAGIVPVAHASDGGGSIRIPASACGLVGLKPTRGRVPLGPAVFESWGGATCAHVISRTVRDSAAFLDATAGGEPGDPYAALPHEGTFLAEVERDPGRLCVALVTAPANGAPVDPEVLAGVDATARHLEALGHVVEPATLPFDGVSLGLAFGVITSIGTAQVVERVAQERGRPVAAEEVEPFTWSMVERGRALRGVDYVDALAVFTAASRTAARFHERFDVVLSPTLAAPPAPIGSLRLDDVVAMGRAMGRYSPFTALANITGQPSISLPLHRTAGGLPVGVMLTAGLGADGVLLRLAGQLERAVGWTHERITGAIG